MSFSKLAIVLLSFVLLSASVFAYVGYVPNTYQSNQVYAGSYFKSSGYGSISGWVYNSYYPSSGYPALGGGTFYPYGYNAGSYPIYSVPSVPVYSHSYSLPYYGASTYAYNYGCGYSICYH